MPDKVRNAFIDESSETTPDGRRWPRPSPVLMEEGDAVALMAYIGYLTGEHVYVVGDDAKTMFHQFVLATLQEWACGSFRLDPTAMAAGEVEAMLSAVRERCMAMGVSPSSNWAQRAMTEFCVGEADTMQELIERHPRVVFVCYADDVFILGDPFNRRESDVKRCNSVFLKINTKDPFM